MEYTEPRPSQDAHAYVIESIAEVFAVITVTTAIATAIFAALFSVGDLAASNFVVAWGALIAAFAIAWVMLKALTPAGTVLLIKIADRAAWMATVDWAVPVARIVNWAASIATFAPAQGPPEYPFRSDREALADDWKVVGRELNLAMMWEQNTPAKG
jgi:hypothetical protein